MACAGGVSMRPSQVKYALCQHGPMHLGRMPGCGFAHFLDELDLPASIPGCRWIDRSLEPGGHSGIDMFFGQQYTAEQTLRLCAAITNEGRGGIPSWARQYAWFVGLGSSAEYVFDGDFGWSARYDLYEERIFGTSAGPDPRVGGRVYPFELMLDADDMNLIMRMRVRLATAREYRRYRALGAWFEVEGGYARATTMHWGCQSRQYLSTETNHEYYCVGVQDGASSPWWYMMPADTRCSALTHGGWTRRMQ